MKKCHKMPKTIVNVIMVIIKHLEITPMSALNNLWEVDMPLN